MSGDTAPSSLRVAGAAPGSDLEAAVVRAHLMSTLFGDADQARSLGRYQLRRLLGRGAHGQVYTARDPQLNRDVAIKVMRDDAVDHDVDEREHERIRAHRMKEAQALAQLSHPHVVEVYDVGVTDDGVYVVMELVDGDDLARVLATRSLSHRDLLAIFGAAGEGLAAAHRVGLVHRDFKPSNVLVGDDLVKVADFGVAYPAVPTQESAESSSLRYGGTPIYMAPEQLRGERVDATADQYAFCIALCEALCGRSPFDATAPAAMLQAKERGPSALPPEGIPRRLWDVLRRGLAARPGERFSAMDALLAALARRADTKRLRRRTGVASAVAVGGAVAWAVSASSPCPDEPTLPWDSRRSDALYESIAAHAAPAPARAIVDDIERYVEGWHAARGDACAATESARASALSCLDIASAEFEATLDALTRTSSARVLSLQTRPALGDLRSPPACLRADGPRREVRSPAATAVAKELARTRAYQRLGQPEAARRHAEAGYVQSRELDSATRARAAWELGRALSVLDRDAAIDRLAEAFYAATEASEPALAVQAATFIADDSLGRNDAEAAEQWLRHATAALDRGNADPILRTTVLHTRANLQLHRRQVDAARRTLNEALALSDGDGFEAAPLYFTRARAGEANADFEAAELDLRRALAIEVDRLGETHPELIATHAMLGNVLIQLERHDAARAEIETAMAIGQRWLSPQSATMARLHESLGMAAHARGEPEEARSHHRRALAVRRETLPADHPAIAYSQHYLGLASAALGDAAEAIALHRQALQGLRSAYGDRVHPDVAEVMLGLAQALRAADQPAEARDVLRRAQAIVDASPAAHQLRAQVETELRRTLNDG